MPRKSSEDWENELVEFLRNLGLTSYRCPRQVPYREIDPHQRTDRHLEFDSLSVAGESLLVGDITDLAGADDVREKYARWVDNCTFFFSADTGTKFVPFTHIPAAQQRKYTQTTNARGFMVLTSQKLPRTLLRPREPFRVFTRADWDILNLYQRCMGPWARYPFLSKLGIPNDEIAPPERLAGSNARRIPARNYVKLANKKVSSG